MMAQVPHFAGEIFISIFPTCAAEWRIYMNHEVLLDGVCEMGYQLLGCGGQIYRVEDTVRRLVAAYGLNCEVFAIPNCLIVSVTDENNHVVTRMRQAKVGSIDILTLERLNALSRRLCANPPEDPSVIAQEVKNVAAISAPFPIWIQLLGFFIGAAFFALFYSGGVLEAFIGGVAGVVAGACSLLLARTRSNFFINTAVSGFVLAFVAYGLLLLGVPINAEAVTVGAIMVLVPGIVFTNFMADLLTGDIVAGLSTFARAVLTAGAIALGTGAAISAFQRFAAVSAGAVPPFIHSPVLACLFAGIACFGFCLPFNIRGTVGTILCCVGGALGWAVYLLFQHFGCSIYVATLAASLCISIYAEVMARIRKCPTAAYLVVSYFPLVPGFTIYQAMDYGIHGNIQLFLETFIKTFGIAGCIALGTLIISTYLHIMQARKKG